MAEPSVGEALQRPSREEREAASIVFGGIGSSTAQDVKTLVASPATWTDAFAFRSAQEEEKKRKELKRQEVRAKQGGKGHAAAAPVPGALVGGEQKNAFWLMMEAHCRNLLQEELRLLLPAYGDAATDPAFNAPPLGPVRKVAGVRTSRKRRPQVLKGSRSALEDSAVSLVSPPADNQACAVCGDGVSYDENKILFCDCCELAVHQLCYGVPDIPDGDWVCSSCQLEKEKGVEASCIICPVKGGALKPCTYAIGEEQAAPMMHLFCSQWTPETYIKPENQDKMEPIEGFVNIPRGRRNLQCVVCKERTGACIQCSFGQCRASFHPMCARNSGLRMELVSCNDAIEMNAFCSKHSKARQDVSGTTLTAVPSSTDIAGGEKSESGAGSINFEASGSEVGIGIIEPEAPEWQVSPMPLLAQCSDSEIASMALASTRTAHKDTLVSLAQFCGLTEEEVLKMAEASTGSELVSSSEVLMGMRRWLQFTPSLLLRHSSAIDLQSNENVDTPDAGASKPAQGSWGNLPMHEPLAWVVQQLMLKGESIPDSSLSVLPELQAFASSISMDSHDAPVEMVNPYLNMLLMSPETSLRLEEGVPQCGTGYSSASQCDTGGLGDDRSALWAGANDQPGLSPTMRAQGSRSSSGGVNYAQMHNWGQCDNGSASMDSVLGFGGSQRTTRMRRSTTLSVPADLQVQHLGGTPVADAVKACVLAGDTNESVEQLHVKRRQVDSFISAAPDDEVLGEILALQVELVQQAACNRKCLEKLLPSVLEDLPRQAEDAARRCHAERDNEHYIEIVRAVKRNAKAERRQQLLREQQATLEAAAAASPRVTPVGSRGVVAARVDLAAEGASNLGPYDLLDPLVSRAADEDAVCVVCGDGTSMSPNVIVFCERCDIGVHQRCYGVTSIPAGEWLCWPCAKHEEKLESRGVPRAQIRPPRWQRKARSTLEGGSSDVSCALCPNKGGAFRRTADGKQWVHEVCARWHPETSLLEAPSGPDAIVGVESIRSERWGKPCSVCGSSLGAVVRCAAAGCCIGAHPLCARRAGLRLAARTVAGREVYSLHCEAHLSNATAGGPVEGAVLEVLPSSSAAFEDKAKVKSANVKNFSENIEKGKTKQNSALEHLKALQSQLDALGRMRLEMEQLRLLGERVRRRERLKREGGRLLRNFAAIFREGDSSELEEVLIALSTPFPEVLVTPRVPRKRGRPGSNEGGSSKRSRLPERHEVLAIKPVVKVDRECMMTAGQAEAVNGKLPKGYLYVPAEDVAKTNSQP